MLSTPNLKKNNQVTLNLPFNDKRLDLLFSMLNEPRSRKEIENLFDMEDNYKNLFSSFFSEKKPNINSDRNYNSDMVRVRYLGHACVLIQTDKSIYFDRSCCELQCSKSSSKIYYRRFT